MNGYIECININLSYTGYNVKESRMHIKTPPLLKYDFRVLSKSGDACLAVS